MGVKRLLLDRFFFAPAFLLLFFLVMSFLEGQDTEDALARVRARFWPALRMNWRVWTPVQFVNINYVPLQVATAPGSPKAKHPFCTSKSVSKAPRYLASHFHCICKLRPPHSCLRTASPQRHPSSFHASPWPSEVCTLPASVSALPGRCPTSARPGRSK
ncbi:peroxisomal membrane protein 2 isoform X6 [Nycticebus coucang]|nr:peroxisomal membrane protein 2 isoform X6 [Nycticebus coucang]